MKRRRTPGMVFAEASDKKLTSGLEKRRIVLQAAGPPSLLRRKTLDRGGEPGDLTGRPEDPINPGGKIGVASFGTFRQGRGLRNDKWPRIQLQRDAGGGVVDRNSSSSRRRY